MKQSTVRVIIVSWNAKADLHACLASIPGSTAYPQGVEVVVVDNASSDGSPEMVRTNFPGVELRETGANLGFSGGNNAALADNRCDYVFLLNSDAMLPVGGLDTLLAWADATPDAGLIGPKVINPDGTLQFSCRRWPTPQAGGCRWACGRCWRWLRPCHVQADVHVAHLLWVHIRHDAPPIHHEHTICERHHFVELGTHHEHGDSHVASLHHLRVHVLDRTHIDTTRGLCGNRQENVPTEFSCHHHLLLVTPRESRCCLRGVSGGAGGRRRPPE